MVEVLVTVVILALGLLGLVGLQTRLQASEMEAYQRSQALVLLDDMANRLNSNRSQAASYVTGTSTPLGTGYTCTVTSSSNTQVRDTCEWSEALKGAAEVSGTNKLGAMVGGRGCVESLGNNQYLISVVWQGMNATSAPPSSVACGQNLYNSSSGSCTSDRCRRAVTTVVRIGTLS